MQKGTVISKGEYQHPQVPQLISLKQFMFVRGERGKKHLYLRFENEHTEACRSFKFLLRRMDAKGNVIREDWYEKKDFTFEAGTTFTFDEEITVEELCTDFRIQLVSAAFGDYLYRIKNAGVSVVYRREKNPDGTVKNKKKKRVRQKRVRTRRETKPRLKRKSMVGAVVALLTVAVVFMSAAILLSMFGEGRIEFTLEGVQYEFVDGPDGTRTVEVTGYNGKGNMLLPSEIEGYTVSLIRDAAFADNERVKNVRVEGLDIPIDAFNSCTNLETLELVDVGSIGDYAFLNCTSLTSVVSDSLTNIGTWAFGDCTAITTINITSPVLEAPAEEEEAEEGAEEAPEVSPEELEAADREVNYIILGENAFSGCTALKDVTIDRWIRYPENIALFEGAMQIEQLTLRNFGYKDEYNVGERVNVLQISELFGAEDAQADLKLVDVAIDYIDQVPYVEPITPMEESGEDTGDATEETPVDPGPLGFCEGIITLESFTIGKSEWPTLPKRAFKGCTALTTLNLAAPVAEVGESACADTMIRFFDGSRLTEIGDYAFINCTNLARVNITQSTPVMYIGKSAFEMCSSLQTMYISGNVEELFPNTFKGCASLYSVTFSQDSEITEITEGLFSGCSSLLGVALPSTVTVVAKEAFADCSAMTSIPSIPELTTIGEKAFKNTAITSLLIEDTVRSIGKGAFEGCNKLVDVTIPYLGGSQDMADPYFGYIFGLEIGYNEHGEVDHKFDKGSIPSSITTINITKRLTAIPSHAFYKCTGLKLYNVEKGVSTLGVHAFGDCKSLTDVTLPEGITSIPRKAFAGCSALTEFAFPQSVTRISDFAFEGAGFLTLEIPDTVQAIGSGAFRSCDKMVSITLPFLGASSGDADAYFGFIFGLAIEGKHGASVTEGEIPASIKQVIIKKEYQDLPDYAFYRTRGLEHYTLSTVTKTIGKHAFDGCLALIDITLPEGVTTLKEYAFNDCVVLTSIVLPTTLETAGESAFGNCVELTQMAFPDAFTELGASAFENCVKLTQVSFGQKTQKIGKRAFASCAALSSFQLASRLTDIGERAFLSCSSLKDLTLSMSDEGTIGEYAFLGCAALTTVTFPESFGSIGSYAFQGCAALTTVTFPEKINTINTFAFADCKALTRAEMAVTDIIDSSAFANCTALTEVICSSKLTTLGESAFAGCTALVRLVLPDDLGTIGASAFSGCKALSNVTYPSVLTSIGASAFAGCTSLPSAILAISDSVGGEAFYGCTSLSEVVFPVDFISVGTRAFGDCTSLYSVTMQGNVMTIGEAAFDGCSSLGVVSVTGSVNEIGIAAFANCMSLSAFAVDGTVTSIYDEAFYGCAALGTLSLTGVSYIGYNAFSSCGLGQVTISGYVTIMDEAFSNCASLSSVAFNDEVASVGANAFTGCKNLVTAAFDAGVGEIGNSAFADCSSLANVIFVGAVNNIGESAFARCTSLGALDISSVGWIGTNAFADCTSLGSVNIGVIYEIGSGAFINCSSMATLVIPVVNADDNIMIGDSAFLNCKGLGDVKFLSNIGTIGDSAFSGCTSLATVTFPGVVGYIGQNAFAGSALGTVVINSVGGIGTGAFSACRSLESIQIAYTGEIGENAFSNCTALKTLDCDTVMNIGNSAFSGCTALNSIFIKTLSYIGESAFSGCTALETLSLRVTGTVGAKAFQNCTALKSVNFINDFDTLGSEAFVGCSGLTTVVFPNSTGYINSKAFYGCKNLTDLALPMYCNEIGTSAFEACTGLKYVSVNGGISEIRERAFANTGLENAVVLSGVSTLDMGVFASCSSLSEITLPFSGQYANGSGETYIGWVFGCYNENLPAKIKRITITGNTSIAYSAFSNCCYLEEVVLGNGVSSIASHAFDSCSSLLFVSLPSSLNSISSSSFYNCRRLFEVENLSGLYISSSAGKYALEIRTSVQDRSPSMTVGNYRFALYSGAWYLIDYDESVTTHILPETVTYNGSAVSWNIPNYMFYENTVITSVILPKNVLTIGSYAFNNCINLTRITLPTNLQSIGSSAFSGCEKLYDVYYAGTALSIVAGKTDNGYVARRAVVVHTDLNEALSQEVSLMNGTLIARRSGKYALILSYTGSDEELILSNLITGVTNLRIAESVFCDNGYILRVVLGSEIAQIQSGAFRNCYNLREVIMQNSILTEIESYTFSECSNLRNVELSDSITTIGADAFEYCVRLETIHMPTSLTRIESYAFERCARLFSVTLPKNLTSIGSKAFYGCTMLYEVVNLTSKTYSAGSSSNGYVAYYAQYVVTSAAKAFERVEVDGVVFLTNGSKWYIFSTNLSETPSVFKIPAEGQNVEVLYYAFADVSSSGVILPAEVTIIHQNAFANTPSYVYYLGDTTAWANLNWSSKDYTNVYYYSTCVHDSGEWTYNADGTVRITACALQEKIILEPTCFTEGEKAWFCTCEGCDHSQDHQTIAPLSHEFADGVCKHCGAKRYDITEDTQESYADGTIVVLKNDATYPFIYTDKGLTSANHSPNTTSTFTITAKRTMTISFQVGTSSEGYADILTIVGPDTSWSYSGSSASNGFITVVLEANESVTFTYSKDYSGDGGEDIAFIKELYIAFTNSVL